GGDVLAVTERWGGGVKLWHPRTGRHLLSLPNTFLNFDRAAADGRLWTLEAGPQPRFWEGVPGREYRTLRLDPGRRPAPGYLTLAVSPDGRLLAGGCNHGVGLWDLESGSEVGFLPLGFTAGLAFEHDSGALLTRGARGLQRWPVRPHDADRGRL